MSIRGKLNYPLAKEDSAGVSQANKTKGVRTVSDTKPALLQQTPSNLPFPLPIH